LAVVSGDGKAYFSTNRSSRGRSAPKIIEEFFGRVNSQASLISIAKMTSPAGWSEPGQTPEFDEYTEGAEYIAVSARVFTADRSPRRIARYPRYFLMIL
jgi:hypothetical protein